MKLFHNSSEYIRKWMMLQPHVKEESLTDWLLFEISQKNSLIFYQAFSRHEEAKNGSDWEWWILTSNGSESVASHRFNAYRFFVQAKKLLDHGRDNYSGLNYANTNGLQIDLLMQNARTYNAFPLYMYYSTSDPQIEEQKKNLSLIDTSILTWCLECPNGCYLSDAHDVYKLLFSKGRKKLDDIHLLNYSYKLSLLDELFTYPNIENVLSIFNQRHVKSLRLEDNKRYGLQHVYGIKHYGKGIPEYLSLLIEQHNENISWFETQMKRELPNVDGIGVIDLRRTW